MLFKIFLITSILLSVNAKASDSIVVDYEVLDTIDIDYDALDDLDFSPLPKTSRIELKSPLETVEIKKSNSKPVNVIKKIDNKKPSKTKAVKLVPAKVIPVKKDSVEQVKEKNIIAVEEKKDIQLQEEVTIDNNTKLVDSKTDAGINSKYLVINFKGNSTVLTDTDNNRLLSFFAKYDGKSKIKIVSYATGINGNATSAKRTSLARALAVRSTLIKFGVKNSAIEVRSLGQSKNPEKTDCVEITTIK